MRGMLRPLLAGCFVTLGLNPAVSMPTTPALHDLQADRGTLSIIDRYSYSPNRPGHTFSRRFSNGIQRLPFDYRPYAY